MSEEPYDLDSDATKGLLTVVVRGFWDLATVERFKNAVSAAEERLHGDGARNQRVRVLIDARAMRVQSQQVMVALQAAFVAERSMVAKSAMLVESALFRLQLQRVTQGERRLFDDEQEAKSWVLS